MDNESQFNLSDVFSEALTACVARGMNPPFIVVFVSINVTIMAMAVAFRDDGSADAQMIIDAPDDAVMQLPINGMVIDPKGEAARPYIGIDGRVTSVH